jgi:hypothetical protein
VRFGVLFIEYKVGKKKERKRNSELVFIDVFEW